MFEGYAVTVVESVRFMIIFRIRTTVPLFRLVVEQVTGHGGVTKVTANISRFY